MTNAARTRGEVLFIMSKPQRNIGQQCLEREEVCKKVAWTGFMGIVQGSKEVITLYAGTMASGKV